MARTTHTENLRPQPLLRPLSEVQEREVEWLWPNRIPLGKLTIVAGDPGLGKSFITLDWAARVSMGRDWPDKTPCPQGGVILVSAEDDPEDTIKPRLLRMHADVDAVVLLAGKAVVQPGLLTEKKHPFNLQDVNVLRTAIRRTADCKLVVIDPAGAYMGTADAHKNSDVRALMEPLAKLAAETEVAIVLVTHLNKRESGLGLHRIMGSVGLYAAARCVWFVADYPIRPGDDEPPMIGPARAFVFGKSNIAPDVGGLLFCVRPDKRVQWRVPVKRLELKDVEQVKSKPGPKPDKREQAEKWLREQLAQRPLPVKEIEARAKAAEISFSGAIQEAAGKLGIVKTGGGGKPYVWALPAEAAQPTKALGGKVEDVQEDEEVRRIRHTVYRETDG